MCDRSILAGVRCSFIANLQCSSLRMKGVLCLKLSTFSDLKENLSKRINPSSVLIPTFMVLIFCYHFDVNAFIGKVYQRWQKIKLKE
jgi:hypothetical protein